MLGDEPVAIVSTNSIQLTWVPDVESQQDGMEVGYKAPEDLDWIEKKVQRFNYDFRLLSSGCTYNFRARPYIEDVYGDYRETTKHTCKTLKIQ